MILATLRVSHQAFAHARIYRLVSFLLAQPLSHMLIRGFTYPSPPTVAFRHFVGMDAASAEIGEPVFYALGSG